MILTILLFDSNDDYDDFSYQSPLSNAILSFSLSLLSLFVLMIMIEVTSHPDPISILELYL